MTQEKLTGPPRPLDPTEHLDRCVQAQVDLAIASISQGHIKLDDVLRVHINTYMNLIAHYGIDVEHTQKLFYDLADGLPDFVAAARLNNMPPAGRS